MRHSMQRLVWIIALLFGATACGLSPGLDLPSAGDSSGGDGDGIDIGDGDGIDTGDGDGIGRPGDMDGSCAGAGAGGMGGACASMGMGGAPPQNSDHQTR